ncbi:RIMS-binding protein 2-like isoform X3 [Oncorhynchus keta]|uniref:RIMS-binding protein 2-like isoform X3 n=1 Tax=Oncorhynchus keta TaxID=8018 RepID=UPI00227CF61A|nr:RIMS-binding protein 2-like isoform X3 [Oncorhynchus keta]
MRGHRSSDIEELLRQSHSELLWIQRQLSIIAARNSHHLQVQGKLRHEVTPLHSTVLSSHVSLFRLLEDRNRALKLEVSTLRQEKQQYITLKTKLQDALQEKNRLNLELSSHNLKVSKYDQVRSEYEQLRHTYSTVSQERDLAQEERKQLQGKLENLEQVLKHMREAAERRQQLEEEHEQALAVLTTKQQEIHLLQRAQVKAEKEHEGAVHLLENHLDRMQVKVRDLELKCRSQTEQFGQLSKDLEDFRLEADTVDILSTEPFSKHNVPFRPENKLSQILNGLAAQAGKGDESSANTRLISKFLRPLQIGDRDRPELLSVNPSTVTTSCPSSPRRVTPSEMEDEIRRAPRSKPRYTGTVRLCTARYSYNPYDGPNEHPEAELPLVAGKYLYVYGTMDDDGFYEGELLDGQRGLVPSNFVEFVQDKEKPSIQPGDTGEDLGSLDNTSLGLMGADGGPPQDGLLGSTNPLGPCSNGTGTLDPEDLSDDIVPYPRRITLIKQLARSVIVAWEPPMVTLGWGNISCYNVLVDGEVRASVPYGGRTKSLLEKLDLDTYTHRVSVQSVTDRGLSDELRCTLMVGANVVVAPYGLRVDDILRDSAELSWLPSNSNYGHTVFLDGAEHAVVRPGRYRLRFVNLKAMTVYKVRVVARPHQVPWQLLMEQREKKETAVEFCTQAAGPGPYSRSGPPLPPQEVQVQCGQAPGVLQVHWKPPVLSPTGTSNGASVIGYAVCTKGQRIAEVLYPLADYVTVELNRIQCLEAREVIVRTLSAQGESQDSQVAPIPNNLLVPLPHNAPLSPPHLHAGPPPPHPHAPPPHLQSPHLPHPQLPMPHPQPLSPLPHRQPLPNHPPHPQPQTHLQPLQPHPVSQPQTHQQPHPPHPGGPPQPLHLQPHPPHPMPQHRLPLLPHPPPQLHQRPVSARDLKPKEQVAHHGGIPSQPWDPTCSPSGQPPPTPMHGHTLEAPPSANLRSPSPQRILPQPRGTPIPDQMAKAIARKAAQRVAAESGRMERRVIYNEQCQAFHQQNSDEEEEDEEGYGRSRRKQGASVDEFLRGSELGRPAHYSHSEEYHSDSSRGSDLSDIMEEDEEELYSEMQLEEGRRRNSHNALKIGNTLSGGRLDRETGRRMPRDGPQPQRRPLMVPSIEITTESNSDGNLSSVTEDVYYGSVARHRTWSSRRHPTGSKPSYNEGYRDRERRSPPNYDESEPEESFRIFVALFDYDPLSMSPNPDAADEELPFKEGQIIRVYGDKDTDGFYRGEIRGGRMGLLPCNMVSEIRAEDEETMDQLIKQGFLPLNTPVDKVGIGQDRRGFRQHQATRRMVALYDYDPRESSPNVDVEAELTFCAGDIISVFGEIDEDGFYYGEINGHRGLVPSNFLEEVPDDVEVYLTDTPSRYAQDEPANRAEAKRVAMDTTESTAPPVRAASPTVRPLCPPGTMRPISPARGPRDPRDNKKKKGLLSKGKKLLKRLSPVK